MTVDFRRKIETKPLKISEIETVYIAFALPCVLRTQGSKKYVCRRFEPGCDGDQSVKEAPLGVGEWAKSPYRIRRRD
jgi:hypothetical protein